ncbi:UvrD-helicase domain-containing protein [Pendulispora albinea]|uniref:DNA 3'-5' helicase n=1 Tax=Pendulispora albinea TaxID=2741071 RepID=A0ABZ2LS47_9BACT
MIFAFRRNLVLAASAGTGKTHSLVGVLVHLLMGASELGRKEQLHPPVDPSRVVATTFSRKAAAEIRSRLSTELERLALRDPDAKYRADLLGACEAAHTSPWSASEMEARARRALERLAHAQIGTLHSFAGTLVRTYALEMGLLPDFDMEGEDEAQERARDAIGRALAQRAEIDPEAVRDLVRASGGVDELVREIGSTLARLEEDGRGAESLIIDPRDAEVLDGLVGELLSHAHYLIAHEKKADEARALVAAWNERRAMGEVPTAAGVDNLAAAVRDFCSIRKTKSEASQGFFDFRSEKLPAGETNAERGYRLIRAWEMRQSFAPRARAARELLVDADREIQRARRRAGALGFGDVLRAARDLLRDHPSIAREVGEGIDALLVDEFQDTSRLQRELVHLLWENDPAARAPGTVPPLDRLRPTGLFVVGDRKQSIYGFRGADVAVFAELCVGLAGWRARKALGIDAEIREPTAPLADLVPLRHNRRGQDELLTFANAFSRRRLVSSGKVLFEINYVPETEDLLPPPERPPPAIPAPRTYWLRPPVSPRGRTPRLVEAFAIADRVRALAADDVTKLGRMAVLCHTNEMLEVVAYALAHEGVPYVVAGRGFFSAREVRDVMAMLALIVRPRDRLALLEVLRGPWVSVRDETLLALTSPGGGMVSMESASAWDSGPRRALMDEGDRARVRTLFEVVARLRRNVDRILPGPLLREAVRAFDLEEVLIQLPRGEQRVANVRKLLAMADRATDASTLLSRLTRAAADGGSETEAATFGDDDHAVRLLTVHASKGLDFPIVFVPEVGADGRRTESSAMILEPPSGEGAATLSVRLTDESGARFEPPSFTRAKDTLRRRDRAEKARLAYVAVTRASEAMYFVGDRRPPKDMSEAFLASIACTLQELAADESLRPFFTVEELPPRIPTASPLPFDPSADLHRGADPAGDEAPLAARDKTWRPPWRTATMATTSLQDFHHCPRRFQLVHVLDLPEHEAPPLAATGGERETDAPAYASPVDPRTEGTLLHRVLERAPAEHFGSDLSLADIERLLGREGVERDHPRYARLARTLSRFVRGPYAAKVAEEGASLRREEPFTLSLEDGRGHTIVLRGTIDLMVVWPDGRLDVLDYKRARSTHVEPYAFQLDVYALAARDLVPSATQVRTGIVFLGGDPSEPRFREPAAPEATRKHLLALALRLVEARHTEAFPRVPLSRCKQIRCGYVSLCHPPTRPRQLALFSG